MRTPIDTPSAADLTSLAAASNALGFDLWSRMRATPGNLAFSPASISTVLAMTWAGTRGDTATEMQRTLRIDIDADAAMVGWGKLAAALQDPSRSRVLRIANRLFGEQTYKFEAGYRDKVTAAYGSPLEAIDFARAPGPAREHINQWVEDQTGQRIKNLLPPDSIVSDTRFVLVNAIYLLADWMDPFKAHDTTEQRFSLSAGKTTPAMMMHRRGYYSLARADGVSMLALPYAGGHATMFVVLPNRLDGLNAVEESLDATQLAAWRRALSSREVSVSLPRFLIDSLEATELSQSLEALGMTRAFDRERADFTAIANPPNPADRLYLDEIFHKAFVKVDEQGTEAAAATGARGMIMGGRSKPALEFKADHPFLFFIVDTASGLVLFMGRVAEPLAVPAGTLVLPQPAKHVEREQSALDRLTITVHEAEIRGGTPCWTVVTNGFTELGSPELVLSLEQRSGSERDWVIAEAMGVFRLLFLARMQGQRLSVWSSGELRAGCFDRADMTGFVLVPCLGPDGIALPEGALTVLVLTSDEVEAARLRGAASVSNLLGWHHRQYPTAWWLERYRTSVLRAGRVANSMLRGGSVFVSGVTSMQRAAATTTVTVDGPGADALTTLLRELTFARPLTISTAPSPHAGARMVWIPGNPRTVITGPDLGDTMTGCFLMFGLADETTAELGATLIEDGFLILMTVADRDLVVAALDRGENLELDAPESRRCWQLVHLPQ